MRPPIKDTLERAILIKRFNGDDLPQNVVLDEVYSHTLRTAEIARVQDLGTEVEFTLLIHDLPEVANALKKGQQCDVTSVDKEKDPTLEITIADEEYEAAKSLLNIDELALYEAFEEAGRYLKGEAADKRVLTGAAVLAQVVDKIDANLTLHTHLSNWAFSQDYNPNLILPNRSLTYAFRQYVQFSSILRRDYGPTSRVALSLLKDHLIVIRNLWKSCRTKGAIVPGEIEFLFAS